MDPKKPTKSKQTPPNLISTVLAQFDIQTQVNKMVVRTFDSLMRSNKQAFDFIKESEHKFIKFEERLSKAETYYQNIEMNINSKVQLTENMSARLQQFTTQFWHAMKQNNNELISSQKRFDQLSMEKKALSNKVAECEKNIKKLQTTSLNMNDKINEEISRVYEVIKETDIRVGQKFFQEKKELLQLSNNIIQSRSLLESKSGLLTELMKDLEIYKNDRPQILKQLEKLFEEVQHRAFKLQLIEMRGYVDSKIVQQASRVNGLCMRLDTQIKVEERDRKKEDINIRQMVQKNRIQVDTQRNQLQKTISKQIQSLSSKITQVQQKTATDISSISVEVSTIKTKYQKQMPQIIQKSSQLKICIDDLWKQTKSTSNQVKEVFSNIDSINQMVDMIVKENNQRKEEMNNLKSNSANQGNTQQQILVLFEKVDIVSKQIQTLEKQTVMNVTRIEQDIKENKQNLNQNNKQLSELITQLKQQLQTSNSKHSKQLTKVDTFLKNLIHQNIHSLQTKVSTLQTETHNLIESKITSIKQQLDQLDKIHQQLKQFKDIFKRQLQENDKVNASVAQKMERVMALFTKLKSDNAVRFEQLTSDLQRRAIQIKSSLADLEEIKKYLSLSSQCINLLLSVGIFNTNSTKQPMNQSLNTTINQQPKSQQSQPKPIKITSILQGWVLQADQTQDKVKYRGQNFTFSNRIKLLQMYLQFLVKQTEKIKGTILQNGKDVFMRVLQSNQDMFQQRKRVTSKRKPSELPKLYM